MEKIESFFNVSEQTQLFLFACVLGAVLGIIFDCFKVLRILKKHSKFAVFLEDVIFIVFCSFVLFIYSTEKARGEIRFFIFIGAFLGFILYILTLGNIIVGIIRKIVRFIYKLSYSFYLRFIKPVVSFLIKIYLKMWRKISYNVTRLFNCKVNNKKDLKESEKMVYNNHTHKKAGQRGETKHGKKSKSKKTKKAFYNKV